MHSPHTIRFILSLLPLLACGCSQEHRDTPPPVAKHAAAPTVTPAKPEAAKPVVAPLQAGKGTVQSHMELPTGNSATSAVLVEKLAPEEVQINQSMAYQVRITNLTDMSLQNVVVSDTLAKGFKLDSSTPKATQGADGTLRWMFDSLAANQSVVIDVLGTPTTAEPVTSCAEVSYNNTLCLSTRVVEPKLKLARSAPELVTVCDPIPVKFTVTNSGTGVAGNVILTGVLPEGLITAAGAKSLSLELGALAAGASREAEVVLKAEKAGKYEHKAMVKANGGLQAEAVPASTVVVQPALTITSSGPEEVYAGRDVSYKLTVTSTGDGAARDVVIEDTLPAGLQVASASDDGKVVGGTVRWMLGTMEPKASKTLALKLKGGSIGTIRNSAKATAYCAPAVATTVETRLVGIPAVLLEVVDVEDPVEVGSNETYVITVTNQGSAADRNILITCQLEKGMEYVSSTGPTPGTVSGATISFGKLASLDPKGVATWKVVVKAISEGDMRFSVSMKSDQLSRPVEETEATNLYM